jgi:hypothetical protein
LGDCRSGRQQECYSGENDFEEHCGNLLF